MFTLAAAETIAGIAGTATAITYTLVGMELTAAGVETYKKLAQGQLGTGAATLYTAPASTTTFVKSIHLANATASDVSGVALYSKGTASANRITGSFTIPANGWAVCEEDGWRVYDANGTLQTGIMPGLRYKYNSSTSAADPGDGKFGFNNNLTSGLLSITAMYISRKTVEGTVVGTLLDAMVGQNVKCTLLFKSSDGSKIISMIATGTYVDNTTYYTVAISTSLLASAGIALGQDFSLSMFRYGTNGSGVPTGGSNGQFLKKLSGTDFDTGWVNFPARQPILTAAADYYVRPDGSDSNSGLANTSGSAFLTIQKAIDTVATLDVATFGANIHVADGTYTAGILVSGPWVGSGAVILIGNLTTPANCIIALASGSADCVTVQKGGALTIGGFKLSHAGTGNLIQSLQSAAVVINGLMDFGTCAANAQMRSTLGATITSSSNYTISGGASFHQLVSACGSMLMQNITITVSGTPAFAAFSLAAFGIIFNTGSTFTGAATGSRYAVNQNGVLQTGNTGNPNYYPGNSAGSTSTGGQYL